ncbi:hypothetical protein [Amycolatopsis dendrobii]|uniref:hypothetical protein n=1 Tax=Amycolatopsis dendrobii TaxID=2760662 RepID=UPI0028AB4679|nr:hypothetical protein [Amycolatopsis dendrobii]
MRFRLGIATRALVVVVMVPGVRRDPVVSAVSIMVGVVVGLTFLFGFGNVLVLVLRLGVPVWVVPLVAPAVDVTMVALLIGWSEVGPGLLQALAGVRGAAVRRPDESVADQHELFPENPVDRAHGTTASNSRSSTRMTLPHPKPGSTS